MKFLEVAVAAPLPQPLTYKVPDGEEAILTPGLRLLVPLGSRFVTGYLLGPAAPPEGDYPVRPYVRILDPHPLFPKTMVEFFRWVANYYHHPIGDVIKTALPAGLIAQSRRRVELLSSGEGPLRDLQQAAATHPPWLDDLLAKKQLSPALVRKIWPAGGRKFLETWQEHGWINIVNEVNRETTTTKTEICVMPEAVIAPAEKLKPSEEKTLALVTGLAEDLQQPVPRRDIIKEYSGARNGLKGLAAKGCVRLIAQRIYRDPFGETLNAPARPAKLTAEQHVVLDTVSEALFTKRFAPFLLHGVTGSGKTEVYLRAAEQCLAMNRDVLVLVPEIALATQLEAHFLQRFGELVALLHSGLSQGERFDQWLRIASGEARIVLGARSAIFAPLADPGLIIVDEEHDSAYKQEDGLRYHARDLVVLRASQQKAAVILGSATPSLGSYHHAQSSKYRLLTLTKRIEDRPLPEVTVVDLQAINTVSGQPPLFSPLLTTALRDNLAKGEQSLIFLNRRGFASLMLCQDCGRPVQCRHCHVSMTFHQQRGQLLCHYCGYMVPSATICADCQSSRLIPIGFGTERIESELHRLFPQARLARLDRDTTARRHDFLAILRAMHQGEIDILVGTQMIAKGHHFPGVTLVGVVWADAGLGMPDFKAGERTFQLLAQVTGRAGRGDKPGRVIVQTHQPDHYSITTARLHDYQALYDREIAGRQSLDYPPFSRLINLCLDGSDEPEVRASARELARSGERFRKKYGVTLLGPAPALLAKLRGRYRWQLLLKSPGLENLHAFLGLLQTRLPAAIRTGSVKLTVDVDPENMV